MRHLEVAELVPQILNRVQADECGSEETNPFDTTDAADRYTSKKQPDAPLRREWVFPQAVKLGPAEHSREGEEQQHRVQENEAADGGV